MSTFEEKSVAIWKPVFSSEHMKRLLWRNILWMSKRVAKRMDEQFTNQLKWLDDMRVPNQRNWEIWIPKCCDRLSGRVSHIHWRSSFSIKQFFNVPFPRKSLLCSLHASRILWRIRVGKHVQLQFEVWKRFYLLQLRLTFA